MFPSRPAGAANILSRFWQTGGRLMAMMPESAPHGVEAQGGHLPTVAAATKAPGPGDRILVRPGVYEESLRIDQPLEIIGDGPVAQVEIRATDASVLVSSAPAGRVANLTLTQAKSADFLGVTIDQG